MSFKVKGDRTQQEFIVNIGEVLGRGRTALVYLGENVSNREKVAVKKIDIYNVDIQLLSRELEFAAKDMQHPNVVRFIDYCKTEINGRECYIFIMEFCDVGTLEHVIRSCKLSLSDVRKIFTQIVNGVKFLHDNELIHRDLKPQNILIKRDPNGSLVAKIGDMGLTRNLSPEEQLATTFVGSRGYMCPEISKGYGFEADTWSLGCILFEMIERTPLIQNEQDWMLMNLGQLNIESRMKESNAHPHCKSLILRMLSYNPEDRPSLDEILDDPFLNDSVVTLHYTLFIVNSCRSDIRNFSVPTANCAEATIRYLNKNLQLYPPSTPQQRISKRMSTDELNLQRIYLLPNGTRLSTQTIDELTKFNTIYVFHQEKQGGHTSGITLPEMSSKDQRASAIEMATTELTNQEKQVKALQLLLQHISSQFNELADVEEEIKRRLDGLSPYLNMLQAKMKDISSGAPHLTAKYYAEFSQIMADAERLQHEFTILKIKGDQLLDKLVKLKKDAESIDQSIVSARQVTVEKLRREVTRVRQDELTNMYLRSLCEAIIDQRRQYKLKKNVSVGVDTVISFKNAQLKLHELIYKLRKLELDCNNLRRKLVDEWDSLEPVEILPSSQASTMRKALGDMQTIQDILDQTIKQLNQESGQRADLQRALDSANSEIQRKDAEIKRLTETIATLENIALIAKRESEDNYVRKDEVEKWKDECEILRQKVEECISVVDMTHNSSVLVMVNRWNVYCVVHAYTKPDDEYVWIIVRNQQDLPKPSKDTMVVASLLTDVDMTQKKRMPENNKYAMPPGIYYIKVFVAFRYSVSCPQALTAPDSEDLDS